MLQPNKANLVTPTALEAEKAAAITIAEATVMIINKLIEAMTKEIEVISARKMDEHKELLQQKQRWTMEYRANIKTIAAKPEMLKLLPDNARAALKVAGQKLADVTDRNAKFLRGAVMATQRLIQNIVSIVKQEVLPKNTYSNPANFQAAMGGYSPTCKPVAINRTA